MLKTVKIGVRLLEEALKMDTANMQQNNGSTPESSAWERGASLVEYALLCCMIAVAGIAAIRLLGANVSSQFSAVASQLQ